MIKLIEEIELTKEQKSKLTFKEKYGKCNSCNKRNNVTIFKNGFLKDIKELPTGYNFILGYTQDSY